MGPMLVFALVVTSAMNADGEGPGQAVFEVVKRLDGGLRGGGLTEATGKQVVVAAALWAGAQGLTQELGFL